MLAEKTELEQQISELKTRVALQAVILTFRARLWIETKAKQWMQ
jgi:hypothetical protein